MNFGGLGGATGGGVGTGGGPAARAAYLVTWPQYWRFRLTGQLATDVTSLGCHADPWNPCERRFSGLADRLGLTGKIAPALRSGDVPGTISPDITAATGLPLHTPVACGIHACNAPPLPHLIARPGAFSVVSTGIWVIVMTIGGRRVTLDPARATLMNINARQAPVAAARFMGGL